MVGDLGVGHAGCHQGDLAIPLGQHVDQSGGGRRAGIVQRMEPGDQPPGGRGGQQGVAAGHRPDRLDQHVRPRPLAKESAGARAQRFENVLVDLERGQDQGLDAGQIFVGGHLPAHLAIEPAPKTPVLPAPISLARHPDPKV